MCVYQPMKAVSESQERDENPTNWIAHETPTNWIALSLDSSLKHYCLGFHFVNSVDLLVQVYT